MEKLIRLLVKEKRVTLFITVIIALGGFLAYSGLPRQESPDVSAPIALIITPYPGASPKDVNDLVTAKIEDEMAKLDGYDYCDSTSHDSASIVVVFFENTVDGEKAMQDVRNAMADVKSQLPSGALDSDVQTDLVETAGIVISLSGEKYTYDQLASFGDQFKNALSNVAGISKFSVEGEVDKEVKINVDMEKLDQMGISLADIVQVLQLQNIEIPSGYLETSEGKVMMRAPGVFDSLDDIRNLIIGISPEAGTVAKLSDVADVRMDLQDGTEKFKQNGKNAVLLTGYFQESKNVVTVGKDVRAIIEDVKKQLPPDLLVEEIAFQPEEVGKSTSNFMINLIEGVILVVIVVFLGMGMRNALVVSAAVPLSILFTFGVMHLMGIKIHQMSLTALIISLGVLVDNAIVISDTAQVRLDGGEDRETAAIKGAAMSAMPVFTATLTTIAAFSPLLGLPGASGEFLVAIPQVLIISIVAAYVVAMFVTPAMAAMSFKETPKNKEKKGRLRLFFHKALEKCLKHRKATVAGTFALLAAVIMFVVPALPSEFFPYVDKDLLFINIESEVPGNIEITEAITDAVSKEMTQFPEITGTTVCVGNGLPKFYVSMGSSNPSKTFAQLVCKFNLEAGEKARFTDRAQLMDAVKAHLDAKIPNAKCTVKLLQNARPAEAKVVMRVSGSNYEQLQDSVTMIKAGISQVEGLTNIWDNSAPLTYQMALDVDRDVAGTLGLTVYDVQRQVNIALYGDTTSVYRKDGKEYDINVKSTIQGMDELKNMKIKSSLSNQKVPLSQFSEFTYSTKQDTIKNYDREQTINIYADPMAGYGSADLETQIEETILPQLPLAGVQVVFDGEREQINESFGVASGLAIAAIFIIYVILMMQFNSFLQPLIILMTVPLSLIGSFVGLWIFQQPLSLTAFLGIIALIGLVVKNGILLIEYINDARRAGLSVDESCVDAVDKRFNAIILSAATTVLGLLPLAFSGSSLFAPMSICLMSGLTVSTFLTLVVVPVFYSVSQRWIKTS